MRTTVCLLVDEHEIEQIIRQKKLRRIVLESIWPVLSNVLEVSHFPQPTHITLRWNTECILPLFTRLAISSLKILYLYKAVLINEQGRKGIFFKD